MTLDEYQKLALRTSNHSRKNELFHLVLGLAGESGEITEKMKKWVRDQDSDEAKLDKDDLAKELGDIMWYVAVLADYLGVPLDEVGTKNIDKLASRQKRNQLAGSGDNR